MNNDDFWSRLASAPFSDEAITSAIDTHLSGKAHGEAFEGVRGLTDKMRAAHAISLPIEAGTKVLFAGNLGAYLSYDEFPTDGSVGEVVTVKSANGDITHHDGKVFVKWDDGKFLGIHAEHLRLASTPKKAALPLRGRHPDYPPIPGMEGPFRFRDGLILYYDPKEGEYYDRKTDTYLYGRGPGSRSGTKPLPGQRRRAGYDSEIRHRTSFRFRKAQGIGDLREFLGNRFGKTADGKLIHKSTNDLWSISADGDSYTVARLFDDEGHPLKG